jgi:cupin 2 domain-containing protein
MTIEIKNLFANRPAGVNAETLVTLFENSTAKIERIVSHSHQSPPDFWYDQADDEWVMVLRGGASLEFADGAMIELTTGDYLTIPRHVKHRVTRTGEETIWLAVHLK